ncbi:MAG: hypothetical protein JRF55_03860 [Deltaproteobacteria bacterium]|nr:hypothetical protein [Deltaproteobacteria bacterium]
MCEECTRYAQPNARPASGCEERALGGAGRDGKHRGRRRHPLSTDKQAERQARRCVAALSITALSGERTTGTALCITALSGERTTGTALSITAPCITALSGERTTGTALCITALSGERTTGQRTTGERTTG